MIKKILVADDRVENRELLREALISPEYEFSEAQNASEALQIMRNQPADLVISDVRMPGISGVDLLKELHSEYPETAVILVTAFGTVEGAVQAMKAGARDYMTRPLDIHELRLIVERALEHIDVQTEVGFLRSSVARKCGFEKLLGHSHSMLQILDQASSRLPQAVSLCHSVRLMYPSPFLSFQVQPPKPTRPSLSHLHYTLRSPAPTRASARTC